MEETEKGYKQTYIGVIPVDWGTVSIDEIIKDISMGPFGSDIKVSNFVSEGVPVLNGFNVSERVLISKHSNFVTKEKAQSLKKAVAHKGDIVITHRGTIGQISMIPLNANYEQYVISQSQFRITVNEKKIKPEFLVLYFHSNTGQSTILESKGHTGVPAIAQPTTTFRKFIIPLPPIHEQVSIVKAHIDMDALVAALNKKIAKKQQIKQGAMQQLLTGKKRLPGFGGEWVEKRVEEFSNTSSGGTPSRSNSNFYTGNIAWVTTSELNDNYIIQTNEYITEEALTCSSAKIFPANTVLMAMYGATIGKLGILKIAASTNQACCAFLCNDEFIDSLFLFYMLRFIRNELISLGSGAGQPNISQTIIKNLTILMPQIKEEQIAIAKILTDMDNEIVQLEKERDKYVRLKAGMMQVLLTGKIRLT